MFKSLVAFAGELLYGEKLGGVAATKCTVGLDSQAELVVDAAGLEGTISNE